MFGKSKLPKLVTLLVAGILILTACSANEEYDIRSPNGKNFIDYPIPTKRKPVANFQGTDLQNPTQKISLQDFANRILVINIWGQWCAPCRLEIPELEKIYQQHRGKNVSLLGINVKDELGLAQDYLANLKVNYLSIFDPGGETLLAMPGVPANTIPTTIVLDKNHRVAGVFLGAITTEKLTILLTKLEQE